MMKTIRNIVIILAVLLILLFVFAGRGIFDDFLPLTQTKGAILLAVHSKEIVDNGKYGIMVLKENTDLFKEKMEEEGYSLISSEDGIWTFSDGNETIQFEEKDFLGCRLYAEVQSAGEEADKVIDSGNEEHK